MHFKYVLLSLAGSLWTTIACGHSAALDEYPERFPGKTLQAIVHEWEPPPEKTMDEDDLLIKVRSLADDWTKRSVDDLKKSIAALLEENRRGEYRKRFANVLNDMEDLLASGEAGHTEEAGDYLGWRVDHMNTDDGFFDELPPGSWDETKQKAEERTRQWEAERNKTMSEIRVKAETALAALRPHWLVQCGAMEFHHRRYSQAADYFGRVCEAYPEHSRAEVAVLMLARMKFDEWKRARHDWQHDEAKVSRMENEAEEGFENYLKRYPKGRFTADAIGWQGGIMRERGYPGGAMEKFLLQAQTPGHPEVRRRAFQQIEWMLRDFVEHPEQLNEYEFPWGKIVAEPCVALRMGYFMLDCESETGAPRISYGDHQALEYRVPRLAGVRAAAKLAWGKLDAALAMNSDAYRGDKEVICEVLHAWSAIMHGEPGTVAGLVREKTQGAGADDALLVRAMARLKMGQAAEGIRGLDQLDECCPESPLRRCSGLRRIDGWLELHQPAVAVAMMHDMLVHANKAAGGQGAEESRPLNLNGEVEQRLSALVTFAPLTELEKASLVEGVPAGLKTLLRGALRIRHLSEGHFAECLRFSENDDFEGWSGSHQGWEKNAEKAATEWRESVSTLKALSDAVEKASGEARAAAWMALGAAWEQRLWQLLDGGSVWGSLAYSLMRLPPASYELRHHARILGMSDAAAAAMLDQRQATAQAIRCYEEALKLTLKGSASSLKTLLALQAALHMRAEFSEYCMDRSVEINVAAQSRLLHDRILAEHAGTDEARQAVWWTFRPSRTLGEWKPGTTGLFASEVELATLLTSAERSDYWTIDWQAKEALKNATSKLQGIFASEIPIPQMRTALDTLRRETRREAPVAKAGTLLNHLDDLDLLLTVPGVSVEARKAYFEERMSGAPVDGSAEMFAPMQDFVAFWNAVITPSTTRLTPAEQKLWDEDAGRGARQRIAQAQVCRMQAFLAKFPKSVKREAALARLAINTLRQSRCHCRMSWIDQVKEATTAYAGFEIERGIAFDRAAVTAALDAYDREFPQGRYHWDVLLMRGIAAAEAHDWPAALRHLVAVLENPEQRSLHLDASNNLCAIFMELLTPEQRPAIIKAVKATPGAWQKLDTFILSPTCGWRLRVLRGWLQTQR